MASVPERLDGLRLTDAQAARGVLPRRMTREEWQAMAETSRNHTARALNWLTASVTWDE